MKEGAHIGKHFSRRFSRLHATDVNALAAWLLLIFLAISVLLAINPVEREAWLLENVIVIATLAVIVWNHSKAPLTNTAYLMIFVFLVLHEIGAHYTYSKVPYDGWSNSVTGITVSEAFGLERNHYDRLLHFLHGLLLTEPTRQFLLRVSHVKGLWSYIFAITMTMAMAMIYELIEWRAAIIFGGDLGVAFLGTQGDVWDAHQDMALASVGAILIIPFHCLNQRGKPIE